MTDDKIADARALIKPLTGHTPGPWVKRTGMHSAWVEQEDGAERFSCTVVGGDGQGGAMDNARLIAAAPALRDTVAALADLAEAQAQEIARLRDALRGLLEASILFDDHPAHEAARLALGETQ